MERVEQQHRDGCCIASLAMCKGISYERALAESSCSHRGGTSRKRLLESIYAMGGSVRASTDIVRPFAPVHIVLVRGRNQKGGWWHAVAMDKDGIIVDPSTFEPQFPVRYKSLAFYLKRTGATFKEVLGIWWHAGP